MTARDRLRLDDWMRPVRGDRYVQRSPRSDVRAGAPGRRRRRARRPVTPRDRRRTAWSLLALPLLGVLAVLMVGPARASGVLGSLFGVLVVQAVQLYRTRHLGWR